MTWPEISPQVASLIRRGAQQLVDPDQAWLDELNRATLSGSWMEAIAADPVLAEGTRVSILAQLLHWAAWNVQHPGLRVPAHVGEELLARSRDLVRRGLDQQSLNSYRTGQSVAWRRWMDICFSLTSDVDELRELLDLTSLSITAFLDDTIEAVTAQMDLERDQLTRGTHAERVETVTLILEGAPISRTRAEAQLGYGITGPHVGYVVWGHAGIGSDQLEGAAEALVRLSGARRRLTVIASADALWVWLPVASVPATSRIAEALVAFPEVQVAVGRAARDLDGFRRSHLDAVVAQQMIARLGSSRAVARFEDVHLVALLTGDPTRAEEFIADTLGALRHADPPTREVVLTYIREGFNTTRTAERLFTHRNTVIRRLARAEELLPRPLSESAVAVAVALDLQLWSEPQAGTKGRVSGERRERLGS